MKKNTKFEKITAVILVVLFAFSLFACIFAGVYNGNVKPEIESPEISDYVLPHVSQLPAHEHVELEYGLSIEYEEAFLISEKTFEEQVDEMIYDICERYPKVDPEIIRAQVFNESTYNPNAVNADGSCVGLMQVSTFWHKDRAERLGVTDFYDPHGNLLMGIDYMAELIDRYEDVTLALMLYSDNHDAAFSAYSNGEISDYAKAVISLAKEYRTGGV